MGVLKLLCLYPLAVLAVVIATLVGFFSAHPNPEGRAFATIIPLANGYLPETIFGSYATTLDLVPPVPDDEPALPRPKNELFRTLPSGAKMPANGLGTCCRASAYDQVSVRRSVSWYLLKGGRLIDTADMYLNHRAVGLGIKDAIARGIPRSEIFVVTKILPRSYGGDGVAEAVPRFLEELGLDYLDLVLLHHPSAFGPGTCKVDTPKACRENAWRKLSAIHASGAVRDVGVSNFNMRQIEEVARVPGAAPVATLQIQYNAFAPRAQHDLVRSCEDKGVVVTAWSSFQGTMMQHGAAFGIDPLQALAAKRGVSVPQLLLRWALDKGVAVIPGTGNPKHMAENLASYDFALSASELAEIDGLAEDPDVAVPKMGFEQDET